MKTSRYKKASSRIAERRKKRRYFVLVLKLFVPAVFLVAIFWCLRANFLQIKDFTILGAETVSSEEIKKVANNFISGNKFVVIPKTNILFLNKEELTDVLLSEFLRLEKVEIGKQFFDNVVELKVAERSADFLWCSALDQCFFMNMSGLIFEKTENVDGKLIFKGIVIGDPLMQNFSSASKIQDYIKFVDTFKIENINTSIIDINSPDKGILHTNFGEIFFSPDDPNLSLVAQNVILLIKETKDKKPNAEFQYIDARFGNKMFYKLY